MNIEVSTLKGINFDSDIVHRTLNVLELEVNYYVAQPDPFGPEWMVGFNIGPVVPNIFDKWIKGQ